MTKINMLNFFLSFSFVGTTCRSVYGPYDPFLASSLAQVQQAVAAGNQHALAGVNDPRLQVQLFCARPQIGSLISQNAIFCV